MRYIMKIGLDMFQRLKNRLLALCSKKDNNDDFKILKHFKIEYYPILKFKSYKELKKLNPGITHLDSYLEGFIYGYVISTGCDYKHSDMVNNLKEQLDKQKIKYPNKLEFTNYVKALKRTYPMEVRRALDLLHKSNIEISTSYNQDWVMFVAYAPGVAIKKFIEKGYSE